MKHYHPIAATLALLVFPLSAQGGLSGPSSAEGEETVADSLYTTLEAVDVTAVKQMSDLRREAEAATLLTRAEVEQIGALTIRGISDVVPNFFMPDYGSRITSSIYVRGIGARMDQPSVGLNVDNVPYLNKDAYDFDIADIASVEMLRGPQSTLYGRNTMAGVINIATLSPMRYEGWRITAEGGNGGRAKVSAGWYHRFNPRVGMSVSAGYSHQSGFFRNEWNGQKTDKENNWNGRMKLHWNMPSGVTLQNTASFGILRQGGYPYEFKDTGKIEYNDTCFYRRFTFTDALTARYSTSRFAITSITSVQHIDDNMTLDQDFLPESYFTLTQKKQETSVTEDVVVRSIDNGEAYQWLAGAFAFYKHLDMQAPVTFKEKGISELIVSHRNESNPDYPIRWNGDTFPLNSDFRNPTWGVALYHKSDLRLGQFTLSGALRLDYERSTLRYHSYCSTSYTILHDNGSGLAPYREVDINIDDTDRLSRDFITLLPSVSAVYEFPSGVGNLYAKWSKGYKAGGFNTQMFSDVLQQRLMGIMGVGAQYKVDDIVGYKPEQSWNYEVGGHFDLAGGKLTIDAALFYIDCRDQQLTMFPDGTTTGRIMTNAGKTRSFGGELSMGWRATERLYLHGSYGYTNARFSRFHDGIDNYKGKHIPYAPGNTLFLQGLWVIPTGVDILDDITLDLNLRGTGDIYWNESNTERQNFYTLLGAGVTVGDDRISLQLWGKNLTDTRYHTFYFMSMGNEFFQRGRGVELGCTLRLNI